MNRVFKVAVSALLCVFAAGCTNTNIKPQTVICTVLGGTLGAGLVVGPIDADDDAAIAGGAIAGAALGYFLCREKAAEPVPPAPAPRAAPQPAPKPAPPKDTDGDGVIDTLDKCPGTPAGVKVNAEGCPAVGEKLMTLEGVNFDTAKWVILPESETILNSAVTVLNDNRTVSVSVEGHADARGTDVYNQGLSERRARAVVDYLVAHGIDAGRLSSVGYGESKPVAPNDGPANWAKNRRVELIVTAN